MFQLGELSAAAREAAATRERLEAEVAAGLIEGGRLTDELVALQAECTALKDTIRAQVLRQSSEQAER